ncbi:APC family permease [Halomarina pelagica]|uniref:APC family permease n=1 Tax=Halomarina pelagica TaxID=2961599 RepID=UPI0020C478BD|nr:APC family permease [Halomarina sp. BND7]
MSSDDLGLAEAVSMAVGGMIGGGIFAVLGVVASTAGLLAWFAFVVAGVIAACAGYSFVRLNALTDERAGPITYIERFTGSTKLAGMTGWTFVFGYVGTMAMYAYAFGGYFSELVGVASVLGVPLRPLASLAAVGAFVGLNVLGAHASGRTEDLLVGLKVAILLLFGVGGVYYGLANGSLGLGLSQFGAGPLIAAAISFVAFEGWELLMFDQGSIENPEETVKRAIFASIFAATIIYVLVAIVTTNLAPEGAIQQHPETALAIAARPFLGQVGFVLIALAAVFSTGSAINATLFSSSRLAGRMVSEDMLPHQIEGDGDGQPVRAVLVLGALTAAFTVYGSLNGITSFASLAFITVFGAVSYLAFRQRESPRTALIPAVGVLGAVATVVALLWHLATREPAVFTSVVLVAATVVVVELLYFEREPLAAELGEVEERVEDAV